VAIAVVDVVMVVAVVVAVAGPVGIAAGTAVVAVLRGDLATGGVVWDLK
jgi:hypothetical protein